MLKQFFTIDEAAAYLTDHTKSQVSSTDVLRLAEAGTIKISFSYRGFIGAFQEYAKNGTLKVRELFPGPDERCYFIGYLTSESPPSIGQVFERLKPLGPGKGYREEVFRQNILRPHKVTIAKTISADPDIKTINHKGKFWGRVNTHSSLLDFTTMIPESEWLIDLPRLQSVAFRPAVQAKPRAQSGDALTQIIWDICEKLYDEVGLDFRTSDVYTALRELADAEQNNSALIGSMPGGVKFETLSAGSRKLSSEQLRLRVSRWKARKTSEFTGT